jgi:hypothetical protein
MISEYTSYARRLGDEINTNLFSQMEHVPYT